MINKPYDVSTKNSDRYGRQRESVYNLTTISRPVPTLLIDKAREKERHVSINGHTDSSRGTREKKYRLENESFSLMKIDVDTRVTR